MIDTCFAVFVLSSFVFLLGFAAVHDVMTLTIPDWVSVSLAVIFPPMALYWGLGWVHVGIGLGIGVLAMTAGVALFFLHAIGGGDVKLVAATSAWYGAACIDFLLVTAIVGGVLALIWMITSRTKLWARPVERTGGQTGLPYGVAIAGGGGLTATDSEVFHVALAALGLA